MAESIVLIGTDASGTVPRFRSWDEWSIWLHKPVTVQTAESRHSRPKRIDVVSPTGCVYRPARDMDSEADCDSEAECNYRD